MSKKKKELHKCITNEARVLDAIRGVIEGIHWGATPEGYAFWFLVHSRLQALLTMSDSADNDSELELPPESELLKRLDR